MTLQGVEEGVTGSRTLDKSKKQKVRQCQKYNQPQDHHVVGSGSRSTPLQH